MTGVLRVLAIGIACALVWTVAASRVADQARLSPAAVVLGASVTQPFGCTTLELEPFDPLCPTRHVHRGIDLAAPVGTAVHAATGGFAHTGYDERGLGLFIAIAFDDHVRILYCHLQSATVASGRQVAAGDVIGQVGVSGLTTGPHLHLEVQVDGRSVDPAVWLAPAAS